MSSNNGFGVRTIFPILKKPTVKNAFKTVMSVAVGYVAFAFITGKQKNLVMEPVAEAVFYTVITTIDIGDFIDDSISGKNNENLEDNWKDKQFLWKNRDDIKNYFNEGNPKKKDSINNVLQRKKSEAHKAKLLKEDSINNKTSFVDLGEGTLLITSLEAYSQNKVDMGDGASIKLALNVETPAPSFKKENKNVF